MANIVESFKDMAAAYGYNSGIQAQVLKAEWKDGVNRGMSVEEEAKFKLVSLMQHRHGLRVEIISRMDGAYTIRGHWNGGYLETVITRELVENTNSMEQLVDYIANNWNVSNKGATETIDIGFEEEKPKKKRINYGKWKVKL